MKAVAYYEAYENMDIEEEDEEKMKENEKIVLESKNSYWAFEFAYDFPKSNIKALENIIIEDKNVFFAFKFAHCIEGANK